MMYELIHSQRRGDVLVVALNRPDRLNAATPEMFDEVRDAVSRLDGARALVLTGNGRAFCAGADVSRGVVENPDAGEMSFAALTQHYNVALTVLVDLPIPVVAAVRGAVAGIGCSLALAADFCIASETAYFLQPSANIGLVPDGGASWIIPRLVGKARATEMLMLGTRIPAERALEWGMIHKVVGDEALDVEAFALAEQLAAGPTIALGLTRRGIRNALESSYAGTLQHEAESQRIALGSADTREGRAAFREKRKPMFTGL